MLSVKYLLTLHGVRIAHIRTDVELSISEVYLNSCHKKYCNKIKNIIKEFIFPIRCIPLHSVRKIRIRIEANK